MAPDRRHRGIALLVAAALAGCRPAAPTGWSGYAEGDYVYVSSPLGGTLAALPVQAGQDVRQGAPLFALDAEAEGAALDEAKARLAAAEAQLADAGKGRRPAELAVSAEQLAQARAQQGFARGELERQQALLAQGFVAQARVDDARTTLRQAAARVAELEAALRVARLPARDDALAAAAAQAEAARQALRQSEWREQQKRRDAPADARVSEVFFRAGEYVPPGQPVLALLPPANLKARFYVPEAEVAALAPGQAVSLQCDGCGTPIAAHVTRIATQAEYTPPVIYSNAQRSKLVFLVEAKPDARDAPRLRPGLPLDVQRAAATP